MFNLLIYKKIYHNNLELKEIYTMHSKQSAQCVQVHVPLYLQIKNQSYFPVNTSISPHPGKYEYFPLFCQPCLKVLQVTFRIYTRTC